MLQHNSLNGKNGVYETVGVIENETQNDLLSRPNFTAEYCDGSTMLSVKTLKKSKILNLLEISKKIYNFFKTKTYSNISSTNTLLFQLFS